MLSPSSHLKSALLENRHSLPTLRPGISPPLAFSRIVYGLMGFSIGSIEAFRNTRTLMAEFSRSKTVATGTTKTCFGVAARLIINVSGLDAKANLTLPFVAAEAHFNRVEAYANLRVEGYVGPDTGEMFPDFTTFDVESYVNLMQSLSAMRKVIGAKEKFIRPTRLWAWAENEGGGVDATDHRLTQGVSTSYALTQIKDGAIRVRRRSLTTVTVTTRSPMR